MDVVNVAGRAALSAINGTATLGTVTTGGDALIDANIVTINTGDAVGLFSVSANDTIGFTAINGSNVDLNARNGIAGQNITSGGDTAVTSAFGNIALNGVDSDSAVTLTAQNGIVTGQSLQSGDRATINAISIAFGSISSLGVVDLTAVNDLAISNITAGGDILANAGTVNANGGIWQAVGGITIAANGQAALANLQSGGPITVTAAQISGSDAMTNSGGNIALTGTNGVTMATLASSGTTALNAPNGAIRVNTLTSAGPVAADGQAIAMSGRGDLTFATLRATNGDATVDTANGSLAVSNATASGVLSLNATNGLIVNGAQAQTITLTSDRTATLNGGVLATRGLTVTSAGLATINGTANGQSISIVSGDIDVGAAGRVGVAGTTNALNLRNGNAGARTYIGGNGQAGAYSLTAAEISRLYGDSITMAAPIFTGIASLRLMAAGTAPDVTIDSFTVNGGGSSANIGTNGSFTIQTPVSSRVIGAVTAANMTATNQLAIIADTSLEIPLGQGSIRLTGNGANGLAGILTLQSADVAVMTSQALNDVAILNDTAAIEQRLSLNDGLMLVASPLAAGTLRLIGQNNILIQNTATGSSYSVRRGFVANRLEITTGSSSTRIVINGQVTDPQNVLLSGLDAISTSLINGVPPLGVGRFDNGSTYNGCRIIGIGGCRASLAPFPLQDVIEYSDNDDREDEQGADNPQILIDMREVDTLTDQPILDEPITGSGNDDLWGPVPNT